MTEEPLRVKAVKPGENGWVTLLTSLVLVMTFQTAAGCHTAASLSADITPEMRSNQ